MQYTSNREGTQHNEQEIGVSGFHFDDCGLYFFMQIVLLLDGNIQRKTVFINAQQLEQFLFKFCSKSYTRDGSASGAMLLRKTVFELLSDLLAKEMWIFLWFVLYNDLCDELHVLNADLVAKEIA